MFATLTIATLLAYLASAALFLIGLGRMGETLGRFGLAAAWIGLGLHLSQVIGMVVEQGASAIFIMPRGLSVVALLLVGGYVVLERIYDVRQVGSLVTPLAVIALAPLLVNNPDGGVHVASGDVVLTVHIALAFLGTASFALAFFLALLYLVQNRQLKEKHFGALFRSLPPLDRLDGVGFRCITVGFPLYTVAILLGFLRLDRGGTFAEAGIVLAVVTWVIYGLVLQARITAGWRGTKAAAMTIAGFLSAVAVIVVYAVR